MSTPATQAITERQPVRRHTYCAKHFREALEQCPLTPDEKVTKARQDETCEECES